MCRCYCIEENECYGRSVQEDRTRDLYYFGVDIFCFNIQCLLLTTIIIV